MIEVIGIRFKKAGKIYYFNPNGVTTEFGDKVIVETVRGIEIGIVEVPSKELKEESFAMKLKPVVRKATQEDLDRYEENKKKEKEAEDIFIKKSAKHNLEMNLVDTEYTFDRSKLIFYFTADGRIDFRELVKDLAYVFKTRIELRQIGVRDEAKMKGGIGICGRPLCCSTFLSEFIPVSIKMAKDQNFSLNPSKISGVCGRLMCCLKNEEAAYEYLNSTLPDVGDVVTTADGIKGEVSSVSALKQLVKLIVENENGDKEIREYKASELTFKPKKRKRDKEVESSEIKALEALERAESKTRLD